MEKEKFHHVMNRSSPNLMCEKPQTSYPDNLNFDIIFYEYMCIGLILKKITLYVKSKAQI